MLQLFSNLYEYYKEGMVPMNFIPEVNILDQYSGTVKEVFFAELKTLANLQSLPLSICQYSSEPFYEFRDLFKNRALISFRDNLDFPLCLHPSKCSLRYLYKEIIQKNKGIHNNEDKSQLLHELYVTFLFLLIERALNIVYDNSKDLDNILYYLLVYGHRYVSRYNKTFNITDFMMTHKASLKRSPRDKCSYDKFLLPNACS